MNINNQNKSCPGFMQDDRLFNDWAPRDQSFKKNLDLLEINNTKEYMDLARNNVNKLYMNKARLEPLDYMYNNIQECYQKNVDSNNIHKIFEENLKKELNKKTEIYSAYEFDDVSLN